MRLALQSFVILLATGFVFLWQQSGLKDGTTPVIAFFVIVYLILSFVRGKARRHLKQKSGNTSDAVTIIQDETLTTGILLIIVLLLMYVTGGFSSLLFFLLYFVSFAIAFSLEPEVVFVYLIAVLLLFLPQIMQGNTADNIVKIGSLLLLSPLAYFFGKEFREHTKERQKIEQLTAERETATEHIKADVTDIITHEKGNLDDEEVSKLKDIMDETKDLDSETE